MINFLRKINEINFYAVAIFFRFESMIIFFNKNTEQFYQSRGTTIYFCQRVR